MTAIWDGDTGTVTITCTKTVAGVTSPVNLTGATLTIITKAKEGGAVLNLAEVPASSDRANGVVGANGAPLVPGTYELVVRAVAGGVTATYPSADKMPEVLFVVANLDAA